MINQLLFLAYPKLCHAHTVTLAQICIFSFINSLVIMCLFSHMSATVSPSPQPPEHGLVARHRLRHCWARPFGPCYRSNWMHCCFSRNHSSVQVHDRARGTLPGGHGDSQLRFLCSVIFGLRDYLFKMVWWRLQISFIIGLDCLGHLDLGRMYSLFHRNYRSSNQNLPLSIVTSCHFSRKHFRLEHH